MISKRSVEYRERCTNELGLRDAYRRSVQIISKRGVQYRERCTNELRFMGTEFPH